MNVILAFLLIVCTSLSCGSPLRYPFSDPNQAERFSYLTENLRCLVCQNQTIADSNAKLAEDLREQVYHQIQAGQTDDEILHYMTERYGDFILFKPPFNTKTLFLWMGPFCLLLASLIICWRIVRKHYQSEEGQSDV